MNQVTVAERLKYLRSMKNKTHKKFAKLLEIPQPSLSAYKNGKNNPTINVLIDIVNKCNVSLDWLTGRTNQEHTLSSMRDFASFMYDLSMKNKIGFKIIVEDKFIDEENENKRNAELVFYGNGEDHPYNADVCNILKELSDNLFNLKSYAITKPQFDSLKENAIEYYSLPLTQKEFEDLSRDEILKRRIEFLKENNLV